MPTEVSLSSLSPLRFLERSSEVWAGRTAVRDRGVERTYAEHAERVRRLATSLVEVLGVRAGDRVAALLPNVEAMLELHYAVPGVEAVLVPMNTRLSDGEYAYILEHSGASVVFVYEPQRQLLEAALERLDSPPRVVSVGEVPGQGEHEELIVAAAPRALKIPTDERALLSINYTSGTTGRPQGVMSCHRGAYLHTLGVIAEARLEPSSAYLWTLPMFHSNGWSYTWAVTAMGPTHVCLPKVEP